MGVCEADMQQNPNPRPQMPPMLRSRARQQSEELRDSAFWTNIWTMFCTATDTIKDNVLVFANDKINRLSTELATQQEILRTTKEHSINAENKVDGLQQSLHTLETNLVNKIHENEIKFTKEISDMKTSMGEQLRTQTMVILGTTIAIMTLGFGIIGIFLQ